METAEPADLLLGLAATVTLALLALTEQYSTVAAGVAAYGSAWCLLRPRRHRPD